MPSVRAFGTEISGNVIKRPNPTYYKEKAPKKQPGPLPQSASQWKSHYSIRQYKPRGPLKCTQVNRVKE